jgi:NAD(P)-dependent dehydrogenase (short-subunit alcohol dehydrogenase family)
MGIVDGKVVVVTGAGRGIGREIALLLAKHGARVVVNDYGGSEAGTGTTSAPADDVVGEITASGGQAVANYDSVASMAGGKSIVDTAVKAFGRIDIVVNNAGILRDRMFHRMSEDEWDAVLKVHLYGAFHLSRAAAPHFKAQRHGAFVHMTSTTGLIGNVGQANYAAAKLGIVALSKSIALDMQAHGVRSNCIAPFAWSRMTGAIPAGEQQNDRIARLEKMMPAKVAPLAVFLAGEASRDINAQVFAVRNNEIFLMSQPRPVRSVHRAEGWTAGTIATHAMPALRAGFLALDCSGDVFNWDPV